MRVVPLVACIGLTGCGSSPVTSTTGLFVPQTGEWTIGAVTVTKSGCDFLAEEEDEPLFNPNMSLALTDDGFTLQDEDVVFVCTLTDQDFHCAEGHQAFNLAGEGSTEDAVLNTVRAQSGAFSSSTQAVVDFSYQANCEGTECDDYTNYWELNLPCETTGSFNLYHDTAKTTESTPTGTAQSALDHAQQCEEHLGPIPGFNCADGVAVPITVDGVEVSEDQQGSACDAPSIAEGDCNAGTHVGRLSGTDEDGNTNDDVVWAFLCRKYDGIVQLIGTNTQSGATCFFESEWDVANEIEGLNIEDGLVIGDVAGNHDANYEATWKAPDEVASQRCWSCHAADPYVHTPYIDGARLPTDSSQPVIPNVTGPDSPYFLVGDAFESRVEAEGGLSTLHINDNGCVACHRFVDPNTFSFQGGPQLDPNAQMPPSDPGSLSADYQALLECSENGPGNTPGCDWVNVPGATE